ncbi:hypothetical protein M758_UG127800 [Ceratodon purpureus]|nr:hypothetical protein M758_UG127800 [Ceratodon purpureus]
MTPPPMSAPLRCRVRIISHLSTFSELKYWKAKSTPNTCPTRYVRKPCSLFKTFYIF